MTGIRSNTQRDTELVFRLVAALLTACIVIVGYLVVGPLSAGGNLTWLVVSLAPPAIYWFGTRGLPLTLLFGVMLLGVTVIGWGSVALAEGDDLVGVTVIGIFVITLFTSALGASLSAFIEGRQRPRQ